MIVGIGCDIVDHSLTKILNWETNSSILNRIFSKYELDSFKLNKDPNFLSSCFAIKEAVIKCLGIGMKDGISLSDIEILETRTNSPTLNLKGNIKNIADKIGIKDWHVSISNSFNFSVAFVIAGK